MKILVTGGSGVVGSHVISLLSKNKKYTTYAPSHAELDICSPIAIKDSIDKYNPDIVLHFAAFRDAARAEEERGNKNGNVWKINVDGTSNIVNITKENKIFLISISTDMVFPGNKDYPGPYAEDANKKVTLDDLSWYGYTKRKAEEMVIKADFSVIRIGNVVVNCTDPKCDYLGKLIWMYDRKKMYPVFFDQYITLSYISELVTLMKKIMDEKKSGIAHVASSNVFTPFELTTYLLHHARSKDITIEKKSIVQYLEEYPFRYPQYGGLQTLQTQKKYQMHFSTWQEIVHAYLNEVMPGKITRKDQV